MYGKDLLAVKAGDLIPAAGRVAVIAHGGAEEPERVLAFLQISDDAPLGKLGLRLRSPWDESAPAELQVVPAPDTAPFIRDLTLQEPLIWNAMIPGAFSLRADYKGELKFNDLDGDVQTASGNARLRMIAEKDGNFRYPLTCKGEFMNMPNVKSATISFKCTSSARYGLNGPITVWVTLFDAAGNPSNTLKGTLPFWSY